MLCLLQAPYAFRLLTCPLPEPVSVSTYALLSFCRRTAEDARLPPDGRLSAGTTRPSAADIPSSFPSLPIVCALSSAPTCVPSRLRRSSCQVRTELEDPPLTTAPCYLLVSPPTACLSFTSPLSPRRQTVSTPHERSHRGARADHIPLVDLLPLPQSWPFQGFAVRRPVLFNVLMLSTCGALCGLLYSNHRCTEVTLLMRASPPCSFALPFGVWQVRPSSASQASQTNVDLC
jgi:hypothetical protein